ncbi:heme exporter protein CcmD [Porticoccaceae bacterium LTM1]|nr:heme exporter protein CcmD [Porticoccaceae bacterium LTM1]
MFQFDSFSAFLNMGGHGPYVWSAVVISLLLMVFLVVAPLRRKRALLQQIDRQVRREEAVMHTGKEV